MQGEVTVTQADRRFADDWNIECRHCSEYEGDFQDDFAQAVAEYRIETTRALEAQIAELRIGWWNDMRQRGVSQDDALAKIKSALAATTPAQTSGTG